MHRAYVICSLVTSIDGKIAGSYFDAPEIPPLVKTFYQLSDACCDSNADLCGATSIAACWTNGYEDNPPASTERFPRTDYVAQTEVERYLISIDPRGHICWESKYVDTRNRPKAHVIEVLTDRVTDDYISYLRRADVSYVFAGKDTVDCQLLLVKLRKLFGIERVRLSGGGIVNQTFLNAGLIDELCILISPLVEGGTGEPGLFECGPYLSPSAPVPFILKKADATQDGGVWVHYIRKK